MKLKGSTLTFGALLVAVFATLTIMSTSAHGQDIIDGGWVKIAGEGQTFIIDRPTTVRYGKAQSHTGGPGNWITKSGPIEEGTCSNGFFGSDPLSGTVKECRIMQGSAILQELDGAEATQPPGSVPPTTPPPVTPPVTQVPTQPTDPATPPVVQTQFIKPMCLPQQTYGTGTAAKHGEIAEGEWVTWWCETPYQWIGIWLAREKTYTFPITDAVKKVVAAANPLDALQEFWTPAAFNADYTKAVWKDKLIPKINVDLKATRPVDPIWVVKTNKTDTDRAAYKLNVLADGTKKIASSGRAPVVTGDQATVCECRVEADRYNTSASSYCPWIITPKTDTAAAVTSKPKVTICVPKKD